MTTWKELERQAVDVVPHVNKRAPGITQALVAAAHYFREGQLYTLDVRSLFLGLLSAGLANDARPLAGNTSTWIAEWFASQFGRDALLDAVEDAKTIMVEMSVLSGGETLVCGDDLSDLAARASQIAKETVDRRNADLRHFFAAMLEVEGVLNRTISDLMDLGGFEIRSREIRQLLYDRIEQNPQAGEDMTAWERILGLSSLPKSGARPVPQWMLPLGATSWSTDASDFLSVATGFQKSGTAPQLTSTRLLLGALDHDGLGETGGSTALIEVVTRSDKFASVVNGARAEYGGTVFDADVEATDPSDNVKAIIALAAGRMAQIFSGAVGHLTADSILAALLKKPGTSVVDRLLRVDMSLPALRKLFLESMEQLSQADQRNWRAALGAVSTAPTFAPLGNDNPDGVSLDDRLGARAEARAFARVAAAKSIHPPLAFAIFGEWGSGKSFFMRLVQAHVEAIAQGEAPEANAEVFHTKIVQIRFNAWHYAETNLWASLVAHIFAELERWDLEQDPRQSDTLFDNLATARELNLQAAERLVETRRQHREAGKVLQVSKIKLKEAEEKILSDPTTLLKSAFSEMLANEDIRDHLDEAAQKLGLDKLAEDAAKLQAEAANLKEPSYRLAIQIRGLWQTARSKGAILGALGIAAFAVIVLSVLSKMDFVPMNGATTLTAFLVWVTTWLISIGWWVNRATKLVKRYGARLERKVALKTREQRKQLKTQAGNLSVLAAAVEEAEAMLNATGDNVANAAHTYASVNGSGRLIKFVKERASDEHYAKHLGLVASIRKDFTQLSSMIAGVGKDVAANAAEIEEYYRARVEALVKASGDFLNDNDRAKLRSTQPKGTTREGFQRIVLYIDDLDRCAPEKVVEVLQAVHLLLSFPLFIVMVAVDSRWLKESLTSHYGSLIGRGHGDQPSDSANPADYLEKIFQVPYWVRSMDNGNSVELLATLSAPLTGLAPSSATNPSSADLDAPSNAALEEADGRAFVRVDLPNGDVRTTVGPPAPLVAESETGRSNSEPMSLTEPERRFMLAMAPWLGATPRRVLRFLNVYRLIKAGMENEELEALEQGGYRALMTQLAIATGAPSLFSIWLEVLERGNETVSVVDDLMSRIPHETKDLKRMKNALKLFAESLDGERQYSGKVNTRELLQFSEIVRRFSFQI